MDERRMIFSNLLNKVPMENICKVFNKTEAEIKADFSYITQKIKNYCFKNNELPIFCDTIEDAQKNRRAIYPILNILNLEKKPEFKIRHEAFAGEMPRGAV
jgi:hypothetical protein